VPNLPRKWCTLSPVEQQKQPDSVDRSFYTLLRIEYYASSLGAVSLHANPV